MADHRALLSTADATVQPTADEPPPPFRLRLHHYLILVSLNSIGAFSSDCYVPNLSDIVEDLNANDQEVSLTIQLNWIFLGLATPIVGNMSDVYGRKFIVCLTLGVYLLGAIGSALAPTISWLIVARCVQGVGESVSIITSAILRDLIDDKQERMKVQAYFTTMRPLMLLGGPSIGGFIGAAVGWRQLMWGLVGWGVLTVLSVYYIPESRPAQRPPPRRDAEGEKPATWRWNPCALLFPGLDGAKFRRMATNADFVGLTIAAAICMGSVRAMLSNISFVYTHYYQLTTSVGGLLISIPPLCGFLSSLVAARLSSRYSPAKIMRWGMAAGVVPPVLMLISAGLPQCTTCLYSRPRWYMTTGPCALIAVVGFFALPAMQVLVLQDYKDMSGLAGGISKLVMTLTSTGASMLVSYYFSDWGKDRKDHYTHYHTQRLLYALAAILVVLQLWFWLVYVPIKRCARAATVPAAGGDGSSSSMFGAGEEAPPAPLRQLSRRFTFGIFTAAPVARVQSTVAPLALPPQPENGASVTGPVLEGR